MGFTNYPNGLTSFGNVVGPGYGFGIGNVYYVCQEANSVVYADLVLKYGNEQKYKNDDSLMLHTSIQSALDVTVANRDDYVLVATDSSDYDLTAALTMTKKGVHLIAPGGLSHNGGIPGNLVRVHQTTAATNCLTSTADGIEVAGFFFKGAADIGIVNLSGTRWHNYIHHNFLGGATTSGASIHVIGGTGALNQNTISDNFIMAGYSSAANKTISSCVGLYNSSCTRNYIARNMIHTGGQTVVTAGVLHNGANNMLIGNHFHEAVATGLGAGTFTEAWTGHTSTIFIDNRVCMSTPAESGGTNNVTHVNNWSSTNGNAILDAT